MVIENARIVDNNRPVSRSLWSIRALVLLVLIQAITYWRVLGLLAEPFSAGGLVALTYLLLTVASLAGLVLQRRWGFYALYTLVPFATIMLSVRFVPLPLAILPLGQRWIGVVALNVAVLALAVWAHYWFRRIPRDVSRGAA